MDTGIDSNRCSGNKMICASGVEQMEKGQSMSHLLCDEKVSLNKSSVGRRKQKGWMVGKSLTGEAI